MSSSCWRMAKDSRLDMPRYYYMVEELVILCKYHSTVAHPNMVE